MRVLRNVARSFHLYNFCLVAGKSLWRGFKSPKERVAAALPRHKQAALFHSVWGSTLCFMVSLAAPVYLSQLSKSKKEQKGEALTTEIYHRCNLEPLFHASLLIPRAPGAPGLCYALYSKGPPALLFPEIKIAIYVALPETLSLNWDGFEKLRQRDQISYAI